MRVLLTLFLLLASVGGASAGFMPAAPAVIDIPIPPATQPTYPVGEIAFLNAAGEPLSLVVESYNRGTQDNGLRLAFVFAAGGVGSPPVESFGDRDSGYSIQLNQDNPPTLWDLRSVINDLPDLYATSASEAFDRRIAGLPPTDLVLDGGIGRGGTTQDVLLELTGPRLAIEWFLFGHGTTAEQLAAHFNLLTDATRVEAGVIDDRLVLSTIDVGSRAFMWLDAVIEAGGENEARTFTDALGRERVFARGADAVVPEPATGASIAWLLLIASLGRRRGL